MVSPNFCSNKTESGFALIELLVVLGLLALIFGFGSFFDSQNGRMFSFAAQREDVLNALRRARAMAINSVCDGPACIVSKPHGVHFDPAKKEAVIFQGGDFSARDDEFDEIIEFENRAAYVDLPAAVNIVFAPRSGNSASSTVILKDDAGGRADILVNASGRIDWQ